MVIIIIVIFVYEPAPIYEDNNNSKIEWKVPDTLCLYSL